MPLFPHLEEVLSAARRKPPPGLPRQPSSVLAIRAVGERDGERLKSGGGNQFQPHGSREQTHHVVVMDDLDGAAPVAQQVRHIGHVGAVLGIGNPSPFEVSQRTAGGVAAAGLGARRERLGYKVRMEQRHATRGRVYEGCGDGAGEIGP